MRMLNPLFASASLCSLFLVTPACAEAQGDKCEELSGPFSSVVGEPCTSPVGLCTHGMLQGDLSAQYDFTFLTLVPAGDPNDPYKFLYTGTSVITTNGGTIETTDTGEISMLSDGQPSPFVTTATIVGGTGRYSKAEGEFVATGMLVNGSATGTYESTLCKDKG